MDMFTEKNGFESDDLDAVTKELVRVLGMEPKLHFYEGHGGDYTVFGDRGEPGGHMSLYPNNHAEVDGPTTHEEDFPELGLILLIQQQGQYFDYGPKLRNMENFKPVLLHLRQLLDSIGKKVVLFDLARDCLKQTR